MHLPKKKKKKKLISKYGLGTSYFYPAMFCQYLKQAGILTAKLLIYHRNMAFGREGLE